MNRGVPPAAASLGAPFAPPVPLVPTVPGAVWQWVSAGVVGLAGLGVLHLWTPPEDAGHSVCLLRRLAGLPCPTCGLTRAFAHLAKGQWRAAIASHPLAPLIAAEIALAWMIWGLALLAPISTREGAGRPAAALRLPSVLDILLLANAVLLVALWLGRLVTGTLPR